MRKVLDHGYIRLRGVMGSDLEVVNDARVSFDQQSDWGDLTMERNHLKPKDKRLLNYLATNGHWSPFSHSVLKFEINMPMVVKNQWIKHRIGMAYLTDEDAETWDNEGWNEMSMRYVSPNDFYIPREWRSAPENKKQGSGENIEEGKAVGAFQLLASTTRNGISAYQQMIDAGVAPEQARLYLPMYAMYTKVIWTTSLYGVIRFLQLRLDEHAQWEIRQYAEALREMVRPLFPETFEAFGL